jgi:CubicO group peptidase (beta-lactamase class C family)
MASLRFVSQKLISPTAQADLQSYLTTLQPTSTATRALNPFAVNSWNYFGVLYGNAFSGEQGFATIGSLLSTVNQPWDQNNNTVPWQSASKMFSAVVFAKMVEENLIAANDTIATYISTGFSGNMTFITNGYGGTGGININGQPGNPAAWTVSTGSFNASTLTLNCLLNYNFGMLYNGFQYGARGLTFALNSTGCYLNDIAAGTEYGKNIIYNAYQYNQYVKTNTGSDAVYGAFFGVDQNQRQTYYNIFNLLAQGNIALAWRPNTNSDNGPTFGSTSAANLANTNVTQQPPFYVTAQLQMYSMVWEILGICMDNKIRSLYAANPATFPYSNWAAYARAKILTPLQMNRSYIINQEQPSLTTPVPNITSLQYDPVYWLITPQVCRANLTVLGGDEAYANLLNSSNFQNCNIAAQYSTATGAVQLPWAVLYGNNATNTLTSLAGTGYSYNVADDSFVSYATQYYNTPADPSDIPIAGIPLAGPITELAKLFMMLLNGGKNQAGQRVLNKQTIDWLFTSRTCGLVPIYSPNTMSLNNNTYVIGGSTSNLNASSTSALRTSTTFAFSGATFCRWLMDRDTGYYAIFGTDIQTVWNYSYAASFPTDFQIFRNIINKNA